MLALIKCSERTSLLTLRPMTINNDLTLSLAFKSDKDSQYTVPPELDFEVNGGDFCSTLLRIAMYETRCHIGVKIDREGRLFSFSLLAETAEEAVWLKSQCPHAAIFMD